MKLVLGLNSVRNIVPALQELMKEFPHSNQSNRLFLEERGKNLSLVFEGDHKVWQEKLNGKVLLTLFQTGKNPTNNIPVLHYRPDDARLNWWETERTYMLTRALEDEVWNWLFPRPTAPTKTSSKSGPTHKPGDKKPRDINGGIEARKQELTKTTAEEVDYRNLWHKASLCTGLEGLWKYVDNNVPDARLAAELTPERAKRVRVLRSIQEKYHAAMAARKTCACGKKPASECGPDDEWEPGCDLGNNPEFAKPATS